MASSALEKATTRLEAYKARFEKYKERGLASIKRGGLVGSVAAGAAAAGVVDGMLGDGSDGTAMLPGDSEIEVNTAAGLVLLVGGLAGMADDYSDHVALAGVGLLAPKIHSATRKFTEAKRAK